MRRSYSSAIKEPIGKNNIFPLRQFSKFNSRLFFKRSAKPEKTTCLFFSFFLFSFSFFIFFPSIPIYFLPSCPLLPKAAAKQTTLTLGPPFPMLFILASESGFLLMINFLVAILSYLRRNHECLLNPNDLRPPPAAPSACRAAATPNADAPWFRTNKNRDVSNGSLAHLFAYTAHSFACSAFLLARSAAFIHLLNRSLTHSRTGGKVTD